MNTPHIQYKIQLVYQAELTAAMHHNHVPPIREIMIVAEGGFDQPQTLDLILDNTLNVWTPWQASIVLSSSSPYVNGKIPLALDWELLAGLTERMNGHIRVTLKRPGSEDKVYQETFPLGLLPIDQWPGVVVLPELLSAYVTPNIPAVQQLIQEAAIELGRISGNPSLNEYQTQDVNRVRQMMAAFFRTIKQRNIIYASVPPSFEQHGQRVRLPDAVLDQHMGNCLDMSLLFAACLEAAGLHPLIVITHGHAFVGGWLIQETFPDPTGDDSSMLTKRLAEGIHEIALIEATAMNAGADITFEQAEQQAKAHLANPDQFVMWIDVKRSRYGGVRPLPVRVKEDQEWKWKATDMPDTQAPDRETLATIQRGEKVGLTAGGAVGRQKLWERKLLDLSLRNNLLNIRINAQTLQIIPPPLAELEDMLANGEEISLLPRPTDWDGQLRQTGLYEALKASDPIADLVGKELKDKRLRCYLPEQHLAGAITNLYRKAKLAMEENGANTLFMAIGLLRWYESDQSERPRFAPLILTPVEIVRRGAQRGFIIRSREEESQMNITLLEMLRQDFGLPIPKLDPLPRDASGVDVKKVLKAVRELVMNQTRWDVEPQVIIGQFSFSKFVMWRDIHEHANLLVRNNVVESLIQNKTSWSVQEDGSADLSPDHQWGVADVLLPISADSSQLKAIAAAVNGESFVLHGPPGTGKSQTITNMIANALYRGKRVLFVAEKMAALEVVEKRLDAIGLGSFCLELHSNKAKKSEVLQQLKKLLEAVKPGRYPSFPEEAKRLEGLRLDLNAYVEALHAPGPLGLSLFDAINAYLTLDVDCPEVAIGEDIIAGATPDSLIRIFDYAEELQAVAKLLGGVQAHPLRFVKVQEASRTVQQQAQDLLASIVLLLEKLQQSREALHTSLELGPDRSLTREHWHSIDKWIAAWDHAPGLSSSLWLVEHPEMTWRRLHEVAENGLKREDFRQRIVSLFKEDILGIDAEAILSEWNAAQGKWFLPRWLAQQKIKKQLAAFAKQPVTSRIQVKEHLEEIVGYRKLDQGISRESSWIEPLLGVAWTAGMISWQDLQHVTSIFLETTQCAARIFKDPGEFNEWRRRFGSRMGDNIAIYASMHRPLWSSVRQMLEELTQQIQKLESVLMWEASSEDAAQDWLKDRLVCYTAAAGRMDQLRDWCLYRAKQDELSRLCLRDAATAMEQGGIASHQFATAVQKGLYRAVAYYQIDRHQALHQFNSELYNDKIRRFEALIRQFEQLSRQEIAATVAERMPNLLVEASRGSEVAILNRAISNNGRGLSIRSLFQQIPNLLPRIAPCMLMSPISVAQYLDLTQEPFDIVIFDEASQMPTSEAVGALARGRSVIVVGDPKQMPPTSFFSSLQFDEDNADKEDLESILDDCLSLPMPSKYLLWHYRSRHESLIAFSNVKFYEHKLLTFPSADDIQTKVQFVPVEGYYDRSKARTNKAEAEAVVADVLRRLQDPALRGQSIGIVTFSSAQQSLIQDMMDARLEGSPELEALAYQREEPLFIKNLENVQGDERDVILFSIGYGPDKEGKVYLNFGPINREGGWRRLNVAVSRARHEMRVFSSLRANHIDPTRTASEGVAALRAFLEYAEKGKLALTTHVGGHAGSRARLIDEIATVIRESGYEVHHAVGTSGFKVDLAVVNPKQPGTYMLAVLVDGKGFAEIPAARDRYVGKNQVLKQLGWKTHHIWSADWWMRSERAISALQIALREAEDGLPEEAPIVLDPLPVPESVTQPAAVYGQQELFAPTAPAASTSSHRQIYQVAEVLANPLPPALDFIHPDAKVIISRQLTEVIRAEEPILRELCYQRVLAKWSISRMGSRIEHQLDFSLEYAEKKIHRKGGQKILTRPDFDWTQYDTYRIPDPADERTKRPVDMIPLPEVANAMRDVVRMQFGLPAEDLLRETAKLFGITRMGPNVELIMKEALKYALKNHFLVKDKDRISAG